VKIWLEPKRPPKKTPAVSVSRIRILKDVAERKGIEYTAVAGAAEVDPATISPIRVRIKKNQYVNVADLISIQND